MRRRILALCSALLALAPSLGHADPALLPPLLDRAPDAGDRWVYQVEPIAGPAFWAVIVEVVEKSAVASGWRCLVEDHREPIDPTAGAPSPTVRREWWFGTDGSIWLGDAWLDGELSVDLRAPLLVLRALPEPDGERRRFGHLGWPRAVKRRGWIRSELPVVLPGARREGVDYTLRLRDRSRTTLSATYEDSFGRIAWTDQIGLARTLTWASVGGVPYPDAHSSGPTKPCSRASQYASR